MKIKTEALLSVAMAGLIAGFTAPHAFAGDDAAATGHVKAEAEKASCKGKEGCKGNQKEASSEKAEKASCKGKDGCSGKGSCKTKESCKAKESCNGKDKAAEAH